MPMSDKKPKEMLVFLEFIDEAEAFLERYGKRLQERPDDFKIISFHPSVKSHLRNKGISSEESFHFCDTASHRKLLLKLEDYTERIRGCCDIKQDLSGVRESYVKNLVLSFRSILAVWLYRVEVISNAAEHYGPRALVSAGYSSGIRIMPVPNTDPSERYLWEIIDQICRIKKGVVKKQLIVLAHGRKTPDVAKRFKENVWAVLCGILERLIKPGKNIILTPVGGHNIDAVLEDLRKELGEGYEIAFLVSPPMVIVKEFLKYFTKRGKRPHRYLFYNTDRKVSFDADFLKQRKALGERICNLIDSLEYRGISPAGWLKTKYRIALEPEVIDKTYYQSVNLSRFLERHRPGFVLSQYARGMTAVMGELCKLKQISSLIIPHGSFTPAMDEYSRKDWKENARGLIDTPYEYVALQTPLAEKFLAELPVESKHLITGPLVFGRKNRISADIAALRRQYARDDEKIVLHASTPKPRDGQRFLNYETTEEYVESMASLIRAVAAMDKVRLIIRYRPLDGLDVQELKSILPDSKSYSIAAGGRFFDYLAISDLVVSYSSTAMEEALQNDIPVLLFDRYNRNRRIAGMELRAGSADMRPSAVYNVDSEDDLKFALGWIFENHLSGKKLPDGMFDEYKYKEGDTLRLSDFIKETAGR